MTNDTKQPQFQDLGVAPKILDILKATKITQPTPIQAQSIPVAITGKDIVGIAQTGTGKTLAFGIPTIQRLAEIGGRALIVLPTRELASQVDVSIRSIGQRIGLRTAVLIGGESKNIQLKSLKRKPHIIIATPGRLIDMLQSHEVSLKDVKIVVLDEADLMFDIGFAPQISQILSAAPKERQTMLFSATMPPAIMKLVAQHMKLPVNIEVAPAGTPAEKVEQEMVVIKREDKFNHLKKLLTQYKGSVLVFCRTKHGVKNLTHKLRNLDHRAAEIHSNRSLQQRSRALKSFKSGATRILVATDIAARGIDVKGIELVVNFDLPEAAEDYVHRIGRTGRAGTSGHAVSFVSPNEMRSVKKIESIIKRSIPLTKLAEPSNDEAPRKSRGRNFRSSGGSRGRRSGGGSSRASRSEGSGGFSKSRFSDRRQSGSRRSSGSSGSRKRKRY